MKSLIMMMTLLLCGQGYASTTSFDLIGTWKINGYLYLADRYPRTVNELDLRYVFNFDHTAVMTITRQSTQEHCEQHLTWDLQGGTIIQSVTWVDPENSPSCVKDPEMAANQNLILTALKSLGPDIALQPRDNSLPVFYIFSRLDRAGGLTHD